MLSQQDKDLLSRLSIFEGEPISTREIFSLLKEDDEDNVAFFDRLHDLHLYQILSYDNNLYSLNAETSAWINENNPPTVNNCGHLIQLFSDKIHTHSLTSKTSCKCVKYIEKIFEKVHGTSNLLAILASDYSNYLNNIGKKELSKCYAEKAVAIQKSINEKDPQLSFYYNQLAHSYMHEGNYKKTITYGLKSVKINKDLHFYDNFDMARSYNVISLAFDRMKQHKMSINYGLKAIKIVEDHFSYEKVILSNLYHDLAISYYKAKDFKNANYFVNLAITNYKIKIQNVADKNLKNMEILKKAIKLTKKFRTFSKYFLPIAGGISAAVASYFIFF